MLLDQANGVLFSAIAAPFNKQMKITNLVGRTRVSWYCQLGCWRHFCERERPAPVT